MNPPQPGDLAPDFSLPLDDGTSFRLAEQHGHPVVLFFYPQDDTTGCTNENRDFSALAADFAALGARVIGISPDTIERHQKFRAKHALQLPLAADPDRQVITAYGLWQPKKLYGREFMGLVRTSFVISADARIVATLKAGRVAGHAAKVLESLRQHLGQDTAK